MENQVTGGWVGARQASTILITDMKNTFMQCPSYSRVVVVVSTTRSLLDNSE
jgi:hypothetical protein